MSTIRALVVDAEEAACDGLCQLLGLLDIRARPAYNQRAAVMALDDYSPDLVFLSENLPERGEQTVLEYLQTRTHLKSVRIIRVISNQDSLEDDQSCEAVPRPVNLTTIERCLRRTGFF